MVSVGLALSVNLVTLVGVLVFGWPPGNVYALFWIENLIIGIWNVPRILSARGTDQGSPGQTPAVQSRGVGEAPIAIALFFCVHYGIFCAVHGVFTGIVAYTAGFRPTFLLLGVPVILILIRYTVETLTSWYGPNGLRWTMPPTRTMFSVYPRIVVLHVSIILAFFVTLGRSFGGRLGDPSWLALLDRVVDLLPATLAEPGVLVVVILVVIKTVVDVSTTRRVVTGAARTPRRIELERSR